MASREGLIDFPVSSVSHSCSIWYKVSGEWPLTASSKPLLVLHGGPGYTHDYLLPLEQFSKRPYNFTVIFFDQLGSGKSTHLPEKCQDYEFWRDELFLDQVSAVVKHLQLGNGYDLFGHSWGGMLAAQWATKNPPGLQRLVLSHAPVSGESWLRAQNRLRERLPEPYRTTLAKQQTIDSSLDSEYLEALGEFNLRFSLRFQPTPPEILKSEADIEADRTVVLSCLGFDDFHYQGFIKTWDITDEVHKIACRTLVFNGVDEGADDELSINAWRTGISDHEYVKFEHSAHFSLFEEPEKFVTVVSEFFADSSATSP